MKIPPSGYKNPLKQAKIPPIKIKILGLFHLNSFTNPELAALVRAMASILSFLTLSFLFTSSSISSSSGLLKIFDLDNLRDDY